MSKDKLKKVRTLQSNVLRRALSEKDFAKLIEKYNSARRSSGYDKTEYLEAPVTRRQKDALYDYFFDNATNTVLAKKYGKNDPGGFGNYIRGIALRLYYQSMKKSELEKELKNGGE